MNNSTDTMTLLNRSSNSSTNALGSNAPFSISNGQATLQLFVLTLAIIGNSFIILAYCRTFKMRTTTNTLVVNLCVADFLSSISEVPYWSVQLVDNRIYVNNNIFCKAMLAVEDLFQVASCLAMCGIAFDRYLALVKGLKGKMTRTRIRVAIAWTWAQSLIAAVPWGILQPTNNERCLRFPHYYEPGIHFRSANILLKSLFIVLPILFTYYVFFRIIKAVRRRRRLGIENNYVQRNWSAEKFAVDAHNRSSKTAIVLFSMYVICTFPFSVAYIWDMATGEPFKIINVAFMVYLVLSLKRVLFPAIYIFRNRAILTYLQETLRCGIISKKHPRSSHCSQDISVGYKSTNNTKDSCFFVFGNHLWRPRVYPAVYDGENKHFPDNLDIYFSCGISEQKMQSDSFTDIIEGIYPNDNQEQEVPTYV